MQPEVASPELHLHSVAIVSFSVLLLPLCSRSPFGGCFCAPSFVCVCAEGAFIVECKKKEKKRKKNSSGNRRQTSGGRRRRRYVVEAKGSWTPIKVSLMPLLMVFDSAANHLKVVCDSAVLFRTAALINSPSYHHFFHGLNSV